MKRADGSTRRGVGSAIGGNKYPTGDERLLVDLVSN